MPSKYLDSKERLLVLGWLSKRLPILGRNVLGNHEANTSNEELTLIGLKEFDSQKLNLESTPSYTRKQIDLLNPKRLDYLEMFRSNPNILGYTEPGNFIIYKNNNKDIRYDEISHALNDPETDTKPLERIIERYSRHNNIIRPGYEEEFSPEEFRHLNNPSEIYSRLMQFRLNNKLDPSKVWNIEEILQLRENKRTKDNNLINIYSDDFILTLFNDVAQSTPIVSLDTYYAKAGGTIKRFRKCRKLIK